MNLQFIPHERFLDSANSNAGLDGWSGGFADYPVGSHWVDFFLANRKLFSRASATIKLTLSVGFFALFPAATAADYHVSVASGLDANPGTLAQPWRTIQKAANTVAPGDTVNIHPGTYTERVTLSGKRATAAEPILFRTLPGEITAVVDQDGVTPPNGTSALLKVENCDHVVFQNIEFRNYKTTSTSKVPIGVWITGDGTGVKLLGCKVHNVWQSNTTLRNLSANGFGVLALAST